MSTAKRPNFFIVGAPKCGTTAWFRYLRAHPAIFFPARKEPNYFATDFPVMQMVRKVRDYEDLFSVAGSESVIGDASAIYLFSEVAAAKIHAYNPGARILILLRQQEDFLPSLHHQALYSFDDRIEDFEQVWRLSGNRPADTIPDTCRDPRLLDFKAQGRFSEQVGRYLSIFPPEQVKVVFFEDWVADPRKTYLDLLDFLGIEDDGRTEFPQVNPAKAHRSQRLGRLITHPPAFARKLVGAVKKLTGRKTLQLSKRLGEALSKPGYRTSIRPELRDEIRRYYEEDNRLLRQLVDRRASAAAAGSRRATVRQTSS